MKKKIAAVVTAFILLQTINVMAETDAVLARMGEKKFMLSDFNRIVGYYDAGKQKALADNRQHAEQLLRLFIQGEVISRLAREKGFYKKPEIIEQLELLEKNFIATAYIKKEIVDKIKIEEADMQAYYKTHRDELKTPETVRVRHILASVNRKTATEDDKKKAREKMEGILKRIKAGEDFAKLATELSDDSGSKAKGGDLGFFPKGRMVPEFDKIVFSMKSGELSGVFETSFGYHICRVEEKKDAVLESFDKLKDKIKEKVLEDMKKLRVEEFFDKVFKDADVEFYPEAFTPPKQDGK